jgi:hypothetical protein
MSWEADRLKLACVVCGALYTLAIQNSDIYQEFHDEGLQTFMAQHINQCGDGEMTLALRATGPRWGVPPSPP